MSTLPWGAPDGKGGSMPSVMRGLAVWATTTALCWIAACALMASSAQAAPTAKSIHDLRHTSWAQRDGAPPGIVAIAQTTDDVLWLATSQGLYRFDALHFEHVDIPGHPELSFASIYSLCAAKDGGLWIGYTLGGAAFFVAGHATVFHQTDGLPTGSVLTLNQESDGTLWAFTTRGLARFSRGKWHVVKLPLEAAGARGRLMDSDDTLWIWGPGGAFTKVKGREEFVRLAVPLEELTSFAESPSGDIWACEDKVILHVGHARSAEVRRHAATTDFLVDSSGWAWITDDKLGTLNRVETATLPRYLASIKASDTLTRADGYGPGWVGYLMEDSSGNVWQGGSKGLQRFSASDLMSLNALPSHPPNIAGIASTIAAGDEGALWIAQSYQQQREFVRYHDRGFVTYPRFLEAAEAKSAARVGRAVWLGGLHALWQFEGDRSTRFALPPHVDSAQFQSITGDGQGGIWASIVRKGVYRFAGGTWNFFPELGTPLVVATDAERQLWLGYPDGRVALFDGKTPRWLSKQDGLDIGALSALAIQGRQVWAGGTNGLARWDGNRFTTILFDEDSRPRNVMGIVSRVNGELWVSCSTGLLRISSAQVSQVLSNGLHVVSAEILDARDGLEGGIQIRPSPALVEGTDGKLWVTTTSGVYGVDPANLSRSTASPHVLMRTLVADGRLYEVGQPLALPPHTSALRIDYQGIDLTSAEKIRYRVQLEGFDKQWQDVRDRREAFFTNLSPGTYRFRVQAHLLGQLSSAQESDLTFTIEPAFEQTRTFQALCALVFAAVVWALFWLRVLQIRRRLHLQYETRMDERERIARDLHDTIVQSAQSVILKVHAVARQLRADDPQRARLDAVLSDADLMLAEGRDRISDLRHSGRSTISLREDLIAIGTSIAHEGGVRFEHATDNAVRDLDPEVADEVFSIGREALLNAGLHAYASRIALEMADTRDGFAMSVIDDGRGMDDATLALARATGHWGLAGMHERAERAGGVLDLLSRPDQGTEVVLRIPSAAAYLQNGRGRR